MNGFNVMVCVRFVGGLGFTPSSFVNPLIVIDPSSGLVKNLVLTSFCMASPQIEPGHGVLSNRGLFVSLNYNNYVLFFRPKSMFYQTYSYQVFMALV